MDSADVASADAKSPPKQPSAHAGPAIQLNGVVALLGSFPALTGLDLTVERGEVALLQGSNGAGKTSALKVVCGLLSVLRGSVVVLGSDVAVDRRSVRRHIAFLGHSTGLYPDLTVEENIRFAVAATATETAGRVQPSAWRKVERRSLHNDVVGDAMDRLEVGGRLASLQVAHLSAGQRRRTALAAIVARRVPLWLLDEPHAALDDAGRDLLDGLVTQVCNRGTTVLMASHDLTRATQLAHRVHTVDGGRITASEPGGAVVANQGGSAR